MKTFLSLLALPALLFIGCVDNSSNITAPDVQNSPNFINLPTDLGQGLGVETELSASKLIKGDRGGDIKLNIRIPQHGSEFGDYFEVKVKVKVQKHSFPDNEEKLFTITMDPEYACLTISPSVSTLNKHMIVDWEIKGIDVSNINPNTFDFYYVGGNNEMLDTVNDQLIIDYTRHKIKLKKGKINRNNTNNTPPDGRYAFIR